MKKKTRRMMKTKQPEGANPTPYIMELEIKAIIEKTLPGQVGDVLKKRLEAADNMEIRIKQLEEVIQANKQQIKTQEALIEDYKKQDARNSTLETREKACGEKERNLKIAELEYKLEAEKKNVEFTKDVALGLVRNSVYKKSVFDSRSGPEGKDSYGNQLYATHTVNTTEENKTE